MSTEPFTQSVYRPRRKRSGNPPPFQLTERDITILRLVARYRFATSEHIRQLVPGSDKNIGNRLKALYEHRYLDRPDCQYDFYRPGGGSKAIVYAIADRGARLLTEQDGNAIARHSSWAQKNASAGRPFLEHTLAITDFATTLRVAVQAREDVELLDGDTLVATFPSETQALPKPYQITVPVVHQNVRTEVGLEPDYAFALSLPKVKRRAFFLVEIDRGTMPIARRDLKHTSILKKLLAYQSVWSAGVHQRRFGWQNFRVLLVTTSRERANTMLAVANATPQTRGMSLFWFTEAKAIALPAPLTHQWSCADGRFQSLLPETLNTVFPT